MVTDIWQWQFDHEKQHLKLDVGHCALEIAYARRYLQHTLPSVAPFDLTDAQRFNELKDYLEGLQLLADANQQFVLLVHAVAALRFIKPQLPQSWYFRFSEVAEWPPSHRICVLDSGLERGEFLLLEQDQRSSLCLLLNPRMSLSPTKKLKQYEVIRVLNDRLEQSSAHPLPDGNDLSWLSPA